jgi:hypothetical protein
MKMVKGAPVVSVGCSLGGDPSVQMLKITALNRYLGADNIEVGGMPAQGRSGGGLFAKDGQLIGVCSGADAHHREGLYVGLDTIQKLLDHCNLAHLYRPIGRGEPGQRLPGKPPVSPEPIDPADAEPGTAEEFASSDGRNKAGTPATNALPRKGKPASPSAEGADAGGDEGAIRDALEEIDTLLSALRAGIIPSALTLHVLFAPTGPIQEVSLNSGWGDVFIELADRFDNAMASEIIEAHANHQLGPREACTCFTLPASHLIAVSDLGLDSQLAEVGVLICQDCGQHWLRYFYEVEAFTGSGRWYLGAITPEQFATLAVERAKAVLEGLGWYYYGGSYFQGHNGRTSGTVMLRP